MNVLVINCGSSSLKFQLIDAASEAVLAKACVSVLVLRGAVLYTSHQQEQNRGKDND